MLYYNIIIPMESDLDNYIMYLPVYTYVGINLYTYNFTVRVL